MSAGPVVGYDVESDILFIRLGGGRPVDERLLDNDIVIGLDEEGNILYVEVWRASQRGLLEALAALARARRAKLEALLSTSPGELRGEGSREDAKRRRDHLHRASL